MRNIAMTALAFLVFAFPASASDELVVAEKTMAQGGLICDTQDEVKGFIALLGAGSSPQEAAASIAGCGQLRNPALVKIIAVGKHEHEAQEFLLVRYEFLGPWSANPPQYGIGAVRKLTKA